MAMARGKRSRKTGLPPGTLVHIGEQKQGKVVIQRIVYDADSFEESFIENGSGLSKAGDDEVTWLNVIGLHDTEAIEKIGEVFDLHHLVLEDIVNTEQRPKTEDYDELLFVVVRMLTCDENQHIQSEQVSFLIGANFVLSFQEREGDVFEPIRERIRLNKTKIRKAKADYLLYSLLDAIVDNYFVVLEKMADRIEYLEDRIIPDSSPEMLQSLYGLRREMIYLRKSVWPLRDVFGSLGRIESPVIHKTTSFYFRDIYDHTIQIADMIETSRDILTGMMDIYLSSVSNRMNEVMKVLTIIATIFIPLTFIAGVYGMNFHYMPELNWRWAYPASLGSMGLLALFMLRYFRRKGWL